MKAAVQSPAPAVRHLKPGAGSLASTFKVSKIASGMGLLFAVVVVCGCFDCCLLYVVFVVCCFCCLLWFYLLFVCAVFAVCCFVVCCFCCLLFVVCCFAFALVCCCVAVLLFVMFEFDVFADWLLSDDVLSAAVMLLLLL